ncbi:hypothetical protein FRC14_007352 [Serendipita sp. 396]|nr:hypothetical protein FRC14_007352 [Serendipita sp. 396]KAG8823699.1 hypothetical protein FRC19_003316 [Serendipita sp. 401]KAG8862354.1 hypothetical protein FRC20_011259 [Serendipita sp. 405]KAG9054884.1 hypothetical protein FS842_003852 [Serendipita sp. 407]
MLRYAANTGRIKVVHQQIAHYAAPAPVYWRKGLTPNSPDRKFSPLKTHLFAQYANIIQNNAVILLLSMKDVPIPIIQKLRADLIGTAMPKTASNPFGIPKGSSSEREKPTLLSIRAHMFVAAMRKDHTANAAQRAVVPLLEGPISVVLLPKLDPGHLLSVLKVLERINPKGATASRQKALGDDPLAMPPPGGGGVRRAKPPPTPIVTVVGGITEGRLFMLPELRDVTKLPSLETLHSQLIGLLSAPASQLAGVLGQAAGGSVVRTLDGFRRGLEEEANGTAKADTNTP